MPVDPNMKCPGCNELIPRWFTYHTCGWRKNGVSVPVESKPAEVKKEVESKTIDQFTKAVNDAPNIEDVFNTMKSLASYMARIEEMVKASIEQHGLIEQKFNMLLDKLGEKHGSTG